MMRKDFVTSSSYNRAIAAKDRRVGDSTSTAQDSYRTHATDSLKDGFQREKNAYNANKSKANHGGEWWGDSSANKASSESNYKTSFIKDGAVDAESADWLQHRRKKNLGGDGEKHYNILTGTETQRPNTGRFDPSKSAKRISIDKMNLQQQMSDGRPYNIISNLGNSANSAE